MSLIIPTEVMRFSDRVTINAHLNRMSTRFRNAYVRQAESGVTESRSGAGRLASLVRQSHGLGSLMVARDYVSWQGHNERTKEQQEALLAAGDAARVILKLAELTGGREQTYLLWLDEFVSGKRDYMYIYHNPGRVKWHLPFRSVPMPKLPMKYITPESGVLQFVY